MRHINSDKLTSIFLFFICFFLISTNASARIYESPFSNEVIGIPSADSEPPVTTIKIGDPQYNAGNNLYIKGSTLISFSAEDYGIIPSGVNYTEYKIDNETSWTRYAVPFTLNQQTDGQHIITYRSVDNASNIEAEKTQTVITDNIPPTGTIAINNDAAYTRTSAVIMTLYASDGGGSGVAKMCVSDTSSCSSWENYAETKAWTLSFGDGTKTVYVWYQDNLGNTQTSPYSSSITFDTTAPELTVSTLSDGSWTNNEVLNVSGEITDNTGIEQLTINDEAVTINPDGSFSHTVELEDGPNTITVRALDLAGNEATDIRTINLDREAPIITITIPPDNIKTNQSLIDVAGTVYEETTVTVKVNESDPVPAVMNGYNFSLTVTLVYGINTIEVTATDLAGNTSTVKRTVTFDDQNPSLSVTNPAQDIKTNQAEMTIRGEAGGDLTAVTVTITIDENIYVPVITGGHFEQPVIFTEEKTCQIYVKAVDEAGNETVVQRNVLYDITAPSLILDPVTSPTNQNSQVLTGTMEEGATVSVTCPTATVGTVAYPTAITWTAELLNMQEGDNPIAVIATDEVGNTSSPVLATITVSMIPVITVSPMSATNEIGRNHTITATLSDTIGNPKPDIPVTFSIISGPNTGAAGICSIDTTCITDENGLVSFIYGGLGGIGTDQILACFINQAPEIQEICSQAATSEWTYPVCNSLSTIQSNFNGTEIAANNYIWFNSIVKVSGRGSDPATLRFVGSKIQFSANGNNYELSLPGTEIVYSPTVTMATTEFSGGRWITTVPLNYTGNIFLSGLAFIVPTGGLPGGINPVTLSGYFMTDTPGITVQWKWAAAVYTQFSADYNSVGVKPIDGDKINPYPNSDHAGTPEYFKSYVIGGARGGGGSNYTGGYSGTTSKTPCPF